MKSKIKCPQKCPANAQQILSCKQSDILKPRIFLQNIGTFLVFFLILRRSYLILYQQNKRILNEYEKES